VTRRKFLYPFGKKSLDIVTGGIVSFIHYFASQLISEHIGECKLHRLPDGKLEIASMIIVVLSLRLSRSSTRGSSCDWLF
jgi:hypothetical protein